MTSLILLLIAAVLISIILTIKHLEVSKGEVKFAAKYRGVADKNILSLESKCKEVCTIRYIKYLLYKVYNIVAHKFAKFTASIAKKIEWRARSVAHKSAKAGAEAQEVRENGYLKDVQSHKDSLDTARVAEESKL